MVWFFATAAVNRVCAADGDRAQTNHIIPAPFLFDEIAEAVARSFGDVSVFAVLFHFGRIAFWAAADRHTKNIAREAH